jgi:hypothetical protein
VLFCTLKEGNQSDMINVFLKSLQYLIERAWFRDQSIWMVGPPGGGPETWPAELL